MLFTVVVPVFNSSKYIHRTLRSIADASESVEYEIILVDDCSSDIDELKNILKEFDKVVLVEKEEKTNAADSRNIGFLRSKGEYVFFLDSDDHFISKSVDRRVILHRENKVGICFGNFITKAGCVERNSNLPDYRNIDMRDYILLLGGDFRSSVLSIDKSQYNNTLFDSESYKHQDWIFAIRCWDKGEKIYFDKSPSTIINIERHDRMSSKMNLIASKYFCEKYIQKAVHLNNFSKRHWLSIIENKDLAAKELFFSIYKRDL